jgi:hypothetical protein
MNQRSNDPRIIRPPTAPAAPKSEAEQALNEVLKAFQLAGARIGGQVGAIAIKALAAARTSHQPVLYWSMDRGLEAPHEFLKLIPADGKVRRHLAVVPLGVEAPAWVDLGGLHLRMDDGAHVFVF